MTLIRRFLHLLPGLLFFLANSHCLSAQDITSIEKSLAEENISDIRRIELLNQLSLYYTMIDSRKALETTNKALNFATAINYEKGLADAYRNLSIVYFYYDENYSISMEYLQSALDIFQRIDDSVGIANCYISLGHAYRNIRNTEKELEYHKKSFDVFSRLKITERIGVTAMNLGESYKNNGDFENSRRYLDYAIRLNDSINKLTTLSTCYRAMGVLELLQKNYHDAEAQFLKALEISGRLGENSQKIATIESMINLAGIYKITGNTKLQLAYLREAAEFSRKYYLISYLQSIYTELILYYSTSNNHLAVQEYISEYKNVSDSVSARQNIDRFNQINSIIQVHELEKNMRNLEEKSLIQNERLRIRNMILIAVFFSVSILVWLLISISRKNKKITEVNKILKSQSDIIETQSQHLEELNNTKDKFFSIVAHDLRSPLVSLKQFSDLLIDQVDSLSIDEIKSMGNNLQSSIDNAIRLADNLLTWARLQMKDYEVKPEKLNLAELISDLNDFYKKVAEKKEIEFLCSVDNDITIFSDRNQIAFVIRNLINNAIKFTNKQGFVNLSAKSLPGGTIQISVTDNGIGFSEDLRNNIFFIGKKQSITGTAGEKGTGLGLILSYEFVKLNKGILEVDSEAGKGTTFRLILKSG
ncbi:MAG: tetratricopeptide repeat-containing sensor histidine kinase [Bacteroidetes bacterium]|nr:tetratricopeptide repeat-containing sensor histidine kinase [Bacteroidota bacterium]